LIIRIIDASGFLKEILLVAPRTNNEINSITSYNKCEISIKLK
jgi:hypothetical protein